MNKINRSNVPSLNHQHQHHSINANQLLKALNTLQQHSLCYDQELSFGQPHKQSHSNHQNDKHMQFQIYMNKKTKPHHQEAKSITKNKRKSVTPLKDMTKSSINRNHTSRLSHTPKTNMSPLPAKQRQQLKQNTKKTSSQQHNSHNMSSSKLSSNTRKILTQKQKKGKSYIPIQHRAEQLLKERQVKLAKIKKQKEQSQLLQQKQCTFKPKLTKNNFAKSQIGRFKKSTNNQSKIQETTINREIYGSQEEFRVNKQNIQNIQRTVKIAKIKTQPAQMIQTITLQQNDPSLQQTINEGPQNLPTTINDLPSHKKYKNQKFNILLDFLH